MSTKNSLVLVGASIAAFLVLGAIFHYFFGMPIWTVSVVGLVLISAMSKSDADPIKETNCPDCGYDVSKARATRKRCPECGLKNPLGVQSVRGST